MNVGVATALFGYGEFQPTQDASDLLMAIVLLGNLALRLFTRQAVKF